MQEIVPPSAVLSRGLSLVGFDERRQGSVRRSKNIERFCTHCGSKPTVYAKLWSDLQQTAIPTAKIDLNDDHTCLEHLLMAVHFLKCYQKDNQSEATFKLSNTTIRKWVWFYVKKIQAMKEEKIVWPNNWGTNFTFTVDGVHCRIYEPGHGQHSKNPAYYSHKFKQAGLAYEIALSVFDNKCVWMNGPFAAGKNDVSIFRSALKNRMNPGELGIADKGYRGEAERLTVQTSSDAPEVREFKSRALARHEKFNAQLKNFGCLSEQFRHGIEKHQMCFQAVAVTCQHQLENGSPLMVV